MNHVVRVKKEWWWCGFAMPLQFRDDGCIYLRVSGWEFNALTKLTATSASWNIGVTTMTSERLRVLPAFGCVAARNRI